MMSMGQLHIFLGIITGFSESIQIDAVMSVRWYIMREHH
jgi:hypothetical protein